jgi:hypothetical protein
MKLKPEIEKILNEYDLSVNIPDNYKTVYHYRNNQLKECEKDFTHPIIDDSFLINKYRKNIPRGWYGFSIGSPTPKNWFVVIDKIIEKCIEVDPNFEIHQIKMKFGGIRFYCTSNIIEDILDVEVLIEENLHDKKLIY